MKMSRRELSIHMAIDRFIFKKWPNYALYLYYIHTQNKYGSSLNRNYFLQCSFVRYRDSVIC